MEYVVILETNGDTWSAYVPDLPGCVAAAPTQEAVRALITEAIDFHIEGLKLAGEPVPTPTIQTMHVRLSA